ncbi:SUKH-4 family immunity protein [Streptomyces microflavus]|uniref:SUKH-4 family immunity protein n=1 Tax=Streptomyces microflavus TaxID=1919 RepID=UPI0036AFEF30
MHSAGGVRTGHRQRHLLSREGMMSSEHLDEFEGEFSLVSLTLAEPSVGTLGGFSLEVPRISIGGGYQALDHLVLVSIKSREFIKFGTLGSFGGALYDPRTGGVFESDREMEEVRIVNTSLQLFCTCVRGLGERYPFAEDESGESWESAAQDWEDFLLKVDPEAYGVRDNYWYELKWAIISGDFS